MRTLFIILLLFSCTTLHAQLAELKAGMKITSSVKVRNAVYALEAGADMKTAVIEISGNNIVVDFNNATLRGNNGKQMPDEFQGIAILVKGGKNITIKNLNARGYKVALMARDVESLLIENCNLSYNYRKHLNSTQEKEDISDWMSYHQNENDEWLRYGAAIYMRDCDNFNVKNNIVTGGQCALMLTNCNEGLVQFNNFSFNSAIGVGMYRSSGNKIINNTLDFNVRGYSHGVYSRGQDSAAILVYEQCRFNVFANNSATHSGDGFFLWAGQSTMDTGQGGCNDNLIFKNNFSYAPTNGIEVTFSRNTIEQNTIMECDHGIWGGYSFNTVIRDNKFALNRIAIAIEHGQEDTIAGNKFNKNRESIRLWARKTQPADWGYAKHRDTRSRDYFIANNLILGDSLVYNISNTYKVKLAENLEEDYKQLYRIDSLTYASLDTSKKLEGWNHKMLEFHSSIEEFARARNKWKDTPVAWLYSYLPGRENIRITEWGPYDYRYPLLWRSNPVDTSGLLRFDVLGPKGTWRVVSSKGVREISKRSGRFPGAITARAIPGYRGEIVIEMEYVGEKVTTQFGQVMPAGKPFNFSFRDARVPLNWQIKWFEIDSTTNPIAHAGKEAEIQRPGPELTLEAKYMNFAWWGGITVGTKKLTQFFTVAESKEHIGPGEYELSVTWDDAVRVYVDGKLVINEWNPSLYKFDESPNKKIKLKLGGVHTFKVEHVELGGFATLSVKLTKL